jgi:hypothetical protein
LANQPPRRFPPSKNRDKLLISHHLSSLIHVLVFIAIQHRRCDQVPAYDRRGVHTFGQRPQGQVAIADHANKMVAITDWQEPYIIVAHLAGSGLQRIAGADRLNRACHDLF